MIESLAKKIGIEFKDISLLQQAVTHRSYLNENRSYKLDHNERLEFLGDAVLELIVTEYLFKNYENPEGELTSWRSSLVNGEMLAVIAKGLGVENFLLANAMEAIIGAIYMDQGYESAKKFVLDNVVVKLGEIIEKKLYLDPKSYFQEKSQENDKVTPSYRVLKESGPDHDRHFIVGAYLGDKLVAEGEGTSKQEAQREAARKGLEVKGWI